MINGAIKIIFLGLVVLTGCKKYPDDDVRYLFKSPDNRIKGTWHLNKIYINGGDSTNYQIKIFSNIEYLQKPMIVSGSWGSLNLSWYNAKGKMSFHFHKDQISFDVDESAYWPTPFCRTTKNWSIKELTNISLKLQGMGNEAYITMEFSKQ